jgi:hypothetical protein
MTFLKCGFFKDDFVFQNMFKQIKWTIDLIVHLSVSKWEISIRDIYSMVLMILYAKGLSYEKSLTKRRRAVTVWITIIWSQECQSLSTCSIHSLDNQLKTIKHIEDCVYLKLLWYYYLDITLDNIEDQKVKSISHSIIILKQKISYRKARPNGTLYINWRLSSSSQGNL